MDSEELLMLKKLAQSNRIAREQRVLDAAEAQQEASYPTIYAGTDPTTGLARLQSSTGDIFYGSPQTNGAVGNGDTIRLRGGGAISRYDAMPCLTSVVDKSKKESSTTTVVGLLVDKAFGYGDDISESHYSDFYPVANYNSTLSINSKSYIFPGSGLVDMRPIGLFIGKLIGNSLKEIALLKDIPGFEANYVGQNYYASQYGTKLFEKDNYYTMGYEGSILKFLGRSTPSMIGFDNFDMSKMDLTLIKLNINTKKISSETLTFRNRTPLVDFYVPEYIQEESNLWQDKTQALAFRLAGSYSSGTIFPYSQTIKYKSLLDGSINYVLIAGARSASVEFLPLGLLIWDIGKINELTSKENIASHLGFNWCDLDEDGIGFRYIRSKCVSPFDCYGAIGGIVIALKLPLSLTPTLNFTELFIPEKFLKGTNGVKIDPSELIASENTDIYELNPNISPFYGANLSAPIGAMPEPLEKRKLTCPYKISKYKNTPYQIGSEEPSDERETALILYTKFNSEKGKQSFGN